MTEDIPNDDAAEDAGNSASDSLQMQQTATGRTVWPYKSEDEVKRAIEKYLDRKTPKAQQRKIFDRLLASPHFAHISAPMLVEEFHKLDMGTRHTLVEHFQTMVEEGADLSVGAKDFAKYLADPNFALREKVASLMIAMGEQGAGGLTRILGYLRHNIPDIRIAAAKVLGAIGPVCADEALPKLNAALKAAQGREKNAESAIYAAIKSIRGETPPPRAEAPTAAIKSLPAEQTEAAADAPAEPAQEPTKKAETPAPGDELECLKGARILIVEDNVRMRKLVVNRLVALKADVEEAEDGLQGLKKLGEAAQGEKPFRAVLLDLMMPRMNGGEMLQRMRKDEALKDTPAIVVTARQERQVVMAIAKLGISGYISKPFKMADVLERLCAVLRGED